MSDNIYPIPLAIESTACAEPSETQIEEILSFEAQLDVTIKALKPVKNKKSETKMNRGTVLSQLQDNDEADIVVKKGRGRPKGSSNKPKENQEPKKSAGPGRKAKGKKALGNNFILFNFKR